MLSVIRSIWGAGAIAAWNVRRFSRGSRWNGGDRGLAERMQAPAQVGAHPDRGGY